MRCDGRQDKHDSIEDAQTALAIYRQYLQLQAQGMVDETIQRLYDVGYETRWEVPS
jgi:PAB-dependent poly(A)-specific ribonuclease subunit 2